MEKVEGFFRDNPEQKKWTVETFRFSGDFDSEMKAMAAHFADNQDLERTIPQKAAKWISNVKSFNRSATGTTGLKNANSDNSKIIDPGKFQGGFITKHNYRNQPA